MAFNFLPARRDQQFLMPPSIAEWLPEGHLAWAIVAAVEAMDLSAFEASHRADGRGGAAYDPAMMVALVLYAYCVGERSSRRIERRCVEDVAFRVLAANAQPDHTTIARFVARHDVALAGLFGQVLELCARAGMVDVGVVAVDGTKVEADASGSANRNLSDLASQIVAEGVAIDAAEDAEQDASHNDVPGKLRDREWVQRAMTEIAAERERSVARRPSAARGEPKVNLTDPDSRIMKSPQGFVQAYNAQAVVSADQVIVAAELTQLAVDTDCLVPMVEVAVTNVASSGKAITTVLADAGYWSPDHVVAKLDPELLIATGKTKDITVDRSDPVALEAALVAVQQRSLTHRDAAAKLGMPKTSFTRFVAAYRNDPLRALARVKMAAKLAEPASRRRYRQRAITIEPVFGQIKAVRGIRRFRRRGLHACAAEWDLIATTHNLLKWWRATVCASPSPT